MTRKDKRRRERTGGVRKRHLKFSDVIGYASLVALLLIIGYLIAPALRFGLEPQTRVTTEGEILRAAVVDQLSSLRPDSRLIPSTVRMLSARGIRFDVFLPGDVTVPFYARLPTQGYTLIVLRVHTGLGDPGSDVPIGLFTNELYDPNRYVVEQASGLLGAAQAGEGSPVVFAVTPKFIRETMRGQFSDTIIVLGGCYGLRGGELAEAFIAKGARVVVGWTGLVDLAHTDRATEIFLEQFLVQGKNIQQAVDETMRIIGPDPFFKSELGYYPISQGGTVLLIPTQIESEIGAPRPDLV